MTTSYLTRRQMLIQSAGAAFVVAGCRGRSSRISGRLVLVCCISPRKKAPELCMKGLYDGLDQQGLVKDGNLEVISSHAQGEISNIPMLVQNFVTQGVDLIVTSRPHASRLPAMRRATPTSHSRIVTTPLLPVPVNLYRPSSQCDRRGLLSPGRRNCGPDS